MKNIKAPNITLEMMLLAARNVPKSLCQIGPTKLILIPNEKTLHFRMQYLIFCLVAFQSPRHAVISRHLHARRLIVGSPIRILQFGSRYMPQIARRSVRGCAASSVLTILVKPHFFIPPPDQRISCSPHVRAHHHTELNHRPNRGGHEGWLLRTAQVTDVIDLGLRGIATSVIRFRFRVVVLISQIDTGLVSEQIKTLGSQKCQ
jgi:hypothetical protein